MLAEAYPALVKELHWRHFSSTNKTNSTRRERRFTLTAGQKGDAPQAAALLEGLPDEAVMADIIDGGRPLLTRFLDANRRSLHSKTL
jgi:hypothetical protein